MGVGLSRREWKKMGVPLEKVIPEGGTGGGAGGVPGMGASPSTPRGGGVVGRGGRGAEEGRCWWHWGGGSDNSTAGGSPKVCFLSRTFCAWLVEIPDDPEIIAPTVAPWKMVIGADAGASAGGSY